VLDGAVSAASVAAEFTGHSGGRVDRVQWQQDKAGRSGSRGVVKRGCSTRGEHNTHWQTWNGKNGPARSLLSIQIFCKATTTR